MPESLSVLQDPARLRLLLDASRPRHYPESAYDSLTRVAAQALDAPVVLVSLVDDQGQFFAGATGLLGEIAVCRATPLSHSFCKHVVKPIRSFATTRPSTRWGSSDILAFRSRPPTAKRWGRCAPSRGRRESGRCRTRQRCAIRR